MEFEGSKEGGEEGRERGRVRKEGKEERKRRGDVIEGNIGREGYREGHRE